MSAKRSMVKLLQADGFFVPGDAERYAEIVKGLPFVEKQYGFEIENFNVILPDIEPVFSKVLGERVVVDSKRSGIFRKPIDNVIHFEEFDSLNEWCFIVALERNTLNLYHHITGFYEGSPYNQVDAKTALDGWQFNYRNLFEWDIHTNILMEPNTGAFIRPWVFHSLESGLVQYYRLITDSKFRVLVMGLPDSSKAIVAEKLNQILENSELMVSRKKREQYRDIDYSDSGQTRHVYRMLADARSSSSDVVILDLVAATQQMRDILNPDIVVWIDDGKSQYESFQPPKNYDFRIKNFDQEHLHLIVDKIKSKRN